MRGEYYRGRDLRRCGAEQDVLAALAAAGYELVEERKKGEWVAMISRRPV